MGAVILFAGLIWMIVTMINHPNPWGTWRCKRCNAPGGKCYCEDYK